MTPPSERNLERVSCKAALYSKNRTKVLLVEYLPGKFGLPGGHIELGEAPEETMRRELREEIGLKEKAYLKKCDFWRHSDGKIILGFAGDIAIDSILTIDKNEIEAVAWTDVADIKSGKRTAGHYDDFILHFAGTEAG